MDKENKKWIGSSCGCMRLILKKKEFTERSSVNCKGLVAQHHDNPFSLSLGWRVEWNRVHVKPREVILPPEIRPLMYAVASIGVIGSVQIKQLFGLEDRKELK